MIRYHVADYRLFHVDGHDFVFLPDHCAVFELTAGIGAILDHARLLGDFTRGEALSGISGPAEENTDFFEELVLRHVFLCETQSVQHHGHHALHEKIPLHTLVLQVTEACNLSCDYCYYQKNQGSPDSGRKMTPAVARRSIDFLLARSENAKILTLVFFGGEPLLNFDLISDAVEYAGEKGAQQNKRFNFAVTTNGTLLTQPIIDFLAEKQVSVTVSMDGDAKNHNQHRRFLNGDPSYQVVFPKIKGFLQQMSKMPVAARVTVTEDTADIQKTLKHLLGMGFAEAGFAPVTTGDSRFQLNEAAMERLLSHFKKLCGQFMAFAREDRLLGFTNLIDLLVSIHEGEIKRYPCGAGLGLFCVDADGRLYLCQRLVGHSAAHMGNIDKGVDENKTAAFRKEVQKDREPLCASCWVRHICAGGCYQEALVREQTMTAPNTHYCRWIKEWTGIGLNVYGRLAIERPEYLDRLARLRGR
jgi:uncharacterized protein